MKEILPTFVIPGAGKSGTSYLAQMLGQHPDIFMPFCKEPAFFSTFPGRGLYRKGFSFYYKNFVGYGGEKEIGDASTVYMYDPESPGLLWKHLGDIRLIFVLRNPIDRVYSNYWQDLKVGKKLPDFRSFLLIGGDRLEEMIYVSQYDRHLESYFRLFGETRILIKFFEDLRSDPRGVLDSTTDFLGLAPLHEEVNLIKRVNPSSIPRWRLVTRLLSNTTVTQTVKEIVPGAMRVPLKSLLEHTRLLTQKPFTYPRIDQMSWEILMERLGDSMKNLARMLEVDLSKWLTFGDE